MTSSSSRRPATWAVPGGTTSIRGSPSTSRHSPSPTRLRPSRTGRASGRRKRRCWIICAIVRTATTSPITPGSEWRSSRARSTPTAMSGWYSPFEKEAQPTFAARGRNGVDLRDHWDQHRYRAFRGFRVHGYPNFFLIYGPYAIFGFAMVEIAVRNILRCLKATRAKNADYIEVTEEAQRAEFESILNKKGKSLFVAGIAPRRTRSSYWGYRHATTNAASVDLGGTSAPVSALVIE
jgi:hypothetical protein